MGSITCRINCPGCGSIAIEKVLTCKDYTTTNEEFDIWECKECTIRFTQNIPDQDEISRYYQSDTYISHSDTAKGFINKIYKIARGYTLNWKMNLVKQQFRNSSQKGNLLDIGAGAGSFLHKVLSSGWSVTGLEPDAGARKICKDKYDIQSDEPEKLFSLPAEIYDVVTMWHVMEHVHELHEYMDQIKRVLKRDGVALIALPNYTSWDAQHYGSNWAAYDVPRHLYHFSPVAMGKLVAQHGMKLVAMKPMWLDAFYIAMLSEGYKNGKPNLIAALGSGLRSSAHALKNNATCSSLVYIIRHSD